MRRMAAILIAAAAPSLAFTCDPTAPYDGDLEVRFVDAGLAVTNLTGVDVYYAVVNPRALVLWAPCTDPADCASLPAGASTTIPYAEILGWAGDAEAHDVSFYYWRLRHDGRQYVPTGLRTKHVSP